MKQVALILFRHSVRQQDGLILVIPRYTLGFDTKTTKALTINAAAHQSVDFRVIDKKRFSILLLSTHKRKDVLVKTFRRNSRAGGHDCRFLAFFKQTRQQWKQRMSASRKSHNKHDVVYLHVR